MKAGDAVVPLLACQFLDGARFRTMLTESMLGRIMLICFQPFCVAVGPGPGIRVDPG